MMKCSASRQTISVVAVLSYLSVLLTLKPNAALAVSSSSLIETGTKTSSYTLANEYYSEVAQGEILVPINLLGAVGKPGVYHVPKQTDIIRLLALAGGTRADADLQDVSIKRRSGETERTLNVNVKQIIEELGSGKPVNLEANDVILVAPREPFISSNTVQAVGFISALLGLVVSSIVIVNQLKK